MLIHCPLLCKLEILGQTFFLLAGQKEATAEQGNFAWLQDGLQNVKHRAHRHVQR